MTEIISTFLMICGIAGIVDVLFFDGKIGVWLSKYLSVRQFLK